MGWVRLVNLLHINFRVRSSVVSCYICPDDPYMKKRTPSDHLKSYKFDFSFNGLFVPLLQALMSLILPYMNRLGSARHLTYTLGMRNPIGATR